MSASRDCRSSSFRTARPSRIPRPRSSKIRSAARPRTTSARSEDRGAVEEAIGDYRRALELSPDYADAHFNLAGALARNGRDGEAIKHWQRYLELDSGSPWARIARAHLDGVEPPEPPR